MTARIAVFWNHLPGYLAAGLRALVADGHEVHLATMDWSGPPAVDHDGVHRSSVSAVEPNALRGDLTLFCGWHIRAINQLRPHVQSDAPRILFFDTQWRANARQLSRLPFARMTLPKAYSHAFVPTRPQAELARRIGFAEPRILWGGYTFDDQVYVPSGDLTSKRPGGFIFAGRLVPEKGVDVLLEAYSQYRSAVDNPWPLYIAGRGPLQTLLDPVPAGVSWLGHLTPPELNEAMSMCSTFVLPSNFEPYGVVVQEAAAAGLTLITTTECGSAAEMVRPGFNGYLVEPRSVEQLRDAFLSDHRQDPGVRREMGENSHHLSKVTAPRRWTTSLLSTLA